MPWKILLREIAFSRCRRSGKPVRFAFDLSARLNDSGKVNGDLFQTEEPPVSTAADMPLAARMRPRTLEEVAGQKHILGPGKLLRRAIEADRIQSILLFGPPG